MILKEVTINELRTNLADIVSRVTYSNDTVVVTKNSKRAAIILSPEEYERLLDPSKRLSKSEWKQAATKLDTSVKKLRANMPKMDEDKLEAIIQKATKEVRGERRKKPAQSRRATIHPVITA